MRSASVWAGCSHFEEVVLYRDLFQYFQRIEWGLVVEKRESYHGPLVVSDL